MIIPDLNVIATVNRAHLLFGSEYVSMTVDGKRVMLGPVCKKFTTR